MKKKAFAIIFFLLASFVTSVDAKTQNRWYMGAKMGWSNINPIKYGIDLSQLAQYGFLVDSNSLPILGVFLGYEFNPNVSVEVENNINGFFPYLILQKNEEYLQYNNIQVGTKLSYPITDEFNFYTKLGGTIFWHDFFNKSIVNNFFTKYNPLFPSLSLGAEYVFNDSFITRFDYTWKNSFKNIIDSSIIPDLGDAVISVGWKFGQSDLNDVFASYDPEFINTQYSVLNENITFPFNSTELKPNAYDKLGKLEEDINRMQLKNFSIVLLGYSDKIGNKKHNQQLSEERAYRIKNYLTSKGFSRDIIIVRGMGDANSLTNQVCNDIEDSSLLVSCLAPDRRVEIEVLSDIQ